MKKLLILGAFIAHTATAETIAPTETCVTSKWFVGLDAGCISGYFNPKSITTGQDGVFSDTLPPNNFYIYRYNLGATQPAWGTPGMTALLNLGYDCKLQNSNILLGFFVGGGISKTSAFLPSHGFKDSNGFGDYIINSPVKMSTNGRLQAGFRFGTASLGPVLPLFVLGWSTFNTKMNISRLSSFKTNGNWNTSSVFGSSSVEKWTNCLMVGFGLEFNLTPALILGFSTNIHIGGSPKYDFTKSTQFNLSNGTVDKNITMKVHAVLVEMLATLKYAFPTCR